MDVEHYLQPTNAVWDQYKIFTIYNRYQASQIIMIDLMIDF